MTPRRIIRMNEATSDDLDFVSLPARQQLGLFNELVDVDARSGNGLVDRVDMVDVPGANYKQPDFTQGGHTVQEVTYHLESTPAPSEPAGAPGTDSYNDTVRATPRSEASNTVKVSQDGGRTAAAYQRDGEPVTTQREQPGRNERIADATGRPDSASVHADSGASAVVQPSTAETSSPAFETGSPDDDADDDSSTGDDADQVPDGSVAQVLAWARDDAARARLAIEKENAKPAPRSSLLSQLNDRI